MLERLQALAMCPDETGPTTADERGSWRQMDSRSGPSPTLQQGTRSAWAGRGWLRVIRPGIDGDGGGVVVELISRLAIEAWRLPAQGVNENHKPSGESPDSQDDRRVGEERFLTTFLRPP